MVLDVHPVAALELLELEEGEHLADGLRDEVDDAEGGGVALVGALEVAALDGALEVLQGEPLQERGDGLEVDVPGAGVLVVALHLVLEGLDLGVTGFQVLHPYCFESKHGNAI